MSYGDKAAENEMMAKKCLQLRAYNAGVSRAYYAAFLHIKGYLKRNRFDYAGFLRKRGLEGREYSHGTIQAAMVSFLMEAGRKYADIAKLNVLDGMYKNRRTADYECRGILEVELRDSLTYLQTVLSVVV